MDYTARSTVRNASLDIYGIIPKISRPQVGLRKDMSFSSFFIIQGQTMNSCLPQLLHILLNISFKLMLRPQLRVQSIWKHSKNSYLFFTINLKISNIQSYLYNISNFNKLLELLQEILFTFLKNNNQFLKIFSL